MADIYEHGNLGKDLRDASDEVQALAEDIGAGNILGFVWVSVRSDHKWEWSHLKAKGLSRLELIGALELAAHELRTQWLED